MTTTDKIAGGFVIIESGASGYIFPEMDRWMAFWFQKA